MLTTKLAAPRPVRSFRSSVLETMRQTARRITRSAIPQRRAAPRPVLCTPVARALSFPRARAPSLNLSVVACPLGQLLVDFLQALGVVGSSDELCCENSRCPAMRKMTKLDNGKHCSSLSQDSNMPCMVSCDSEGDEIALNPCSPKQEGGITCRLGFLSEAGYSMSLLDDDCVFRTFAPSILSNCSFPAVCLVEPLFGQSSPPEVVLPLLQGRTASPTRRMRLLVK